MSATLTTSPIGGATFFSAPFASDLVTLDADIAVLGIPYGVPYGMRGVANDASGAPQVIREASTRFGHGRFLTHFDFDFDSDLLDGKPVRIVDCGDVAADPLDIPGNSVRATEVVKRILERGAVPVILGGDDSIPIPVLRAFEHYGPLTLVQIDAHLDFRDDVDGVREGYSSPMRRAAEMPWIEHIVQIGMRGVGSARPSDVAEARAHGNIIIRARELREQGVDAILPRIPGEAPFFVTIDFDGFDPGVAPGVGAPMPGGLSFEEGADILRGLASRGRIAGVDLVELAPSRDVNHLTSLVAVRLITNLLGAMVRSGQVG